MEAAEKTKRHIVWVGEKDRVASFHAVEDYTLHTFDCHENFILYLQSLQRKGFRFQ